MAAKDSLPEIVGKLTLALSKLDPLAPRTFLMGLLGALVAAFLVVVVMALLGEYTKARGQLLLTFLTLAPFCLSAIPSSVLLRRGQYQPVGWAGLLANGAGFILVATGIWATPNADAFWKLAAIASIFAASLFVVSWLLLMTPAKTLVLRLVFMVMATTALTALLSVVGIIGEIKLAAYWWPVMLLLFASAVGTLILLAVDRRLQTSTVSQKRTQNPASPSPLS
jgi:hypothetical protein